MKIFYHGFWDITVTLSICAITHHMYVLMAQNVYEASLEGNSL